jgi:predicted Rossmann fold nucleotide-binding protein DprA/Smf involved in DNA uptake
MNIKELTNDAKAILLLCGCFGKKDRGNAVKPFSLREYNQLADWMMDRHARLGDLLTNTGTRFLETFPSGIDVARMKRLLSRGAAMALAVEKWTNNGIWVICRSDSFYPERLKQHLKKQAPAVLYGVGDIDLLLRGGLAVVGSRNIDNQGETYARKVAEESALKGIQIVSGGARGVDQIAMLSALEAGGTVVGVLADSLIKAAVAGKYRAGIREKRMVLVSPFFPDARFNVGNAMTRNKYIYALADFALVVSAAKKKGGTWAGATEELRRDGARPVFVRHGEGIPEGNHVLLELGARPFQKPPWKEDLAMFLKETGEAHRRPSSRQMSLFGKPYAEKPAAAAIKEGLETYPAESDLITDTDPFQKPATVKPATRVYEAILPLLLRAMEDWRSPKDLAEELEVHTVQLDDWLRRAVDEYKVEKKSRPVLYRRISRNTG